MTESHHIMVWTNHIMTCKHQMKLGWPWSDSVGVPYLSGQYKFGHSNVHNGPHIKGTCNIIPSKLSLYPSYIYILSKFYLLCSIQRLTFPLTAINTMVRAILLLMLVIKEYITPATLLSEYRISTIHLHSVYMFMSLYS